MSGKTRIHVRRVLAGALGSMLTVAAMSAAAAPVARSPSGPSAAPDADGGSRTTTPIRHLVVIFQENVAFDHYFATYPHARNPAGEPRFVPSPATPSVNGLRGGLLSDNPNAANPFRQDRSQAFQCTNHHAYNLQQQAMHGGLMDQFVQVLGPTDPGCSPRQVMSYFDGNTVTALWNYAQHFSLGDNFFATTTASPPPASSTWSPARPTARPRTTSPARSPTAA